MYNEIWYRRILLTQDRKNNKKKKRKRKTGVTKTRRSVQVPAEAVKDWHAE